MTDNVEEQFKLADDSARSAVAIIRALRKGDYASVMDLVNTLSPEEQGNLVGSLAAFANQLLNILDQVTGNRADEVLSAIAIGLAKPEDLGPWKD